jgi:probable selenium-dependent hydroxylase accessory protein YqeC
MSPSLTTAFELDDDGDTDSLACFVGAGGKKTTMYALAASLDRAVVTATVRIPLFDPQVARVEVSEAPLEALEAVVDGGGSDDWPLGLVPEQEGDDRYRGYDTKTVADLAAAHDGPVLVKADGARMREFKAPGEHEPQIPDSADLVVPVASALVVGRPLTDEIVHRPGRVADVADIDVGDEVTPEVVARVLASEHGGLKGVPEGATVIPLVNKVDGDEQAAPAREIADRVLELTDENLVPRVVLARMATPEVVEVVEHEP